MHPNTIFRKATDADNLAFARTRGFATLAVSQDGPPLLAHVPFLLSEDGHEAELHLVRSNPIARAIRSPVPVRLAVQGPDSYVSPDWYGIDDQVPTWNYVAVHLTGTLEPMPAEALRGVLDRLSAQFEAQLAPKPAWLLDKTTPETVEKLMRMIAPFRLRIEQVDGTWKLSQNKPDAARQTAASHIAESGIGMGRETLADLMKSAIMGNKD